MTATFVKPRPDRRHFDYDNYADARNYRARRMLVLGLGTGLGSALIVVTAYLGRWSFPYKTRSSFEEGESICSRVGFTMREW